MPSGWEVYYVVFLSALLALGIPATLGLLSRLFFAKRTDTQLQSQKADLPIVSDPSESSVTSKHVNTRFFLAANSALVLIALGLLMIPAAVMLRPSTGEAGNENLVSGLVAILSVIVFAGLGLLYSARKGDLNWIQSFRRESASHGSSEDPR